MTCVHVTRAKWGQFVIYPTLTVPLCLSSLEWGFIKIKNINFKRIPCFIVVVIALFCVAACEYPKGNAPATNSPSQSASSSITPCPSNQINDCQILDSQLIGLIGKTANEISSDYSEFTFLDVISGFNYFVDNDSGLTYLFDAYDNEGMDVETLSSNTICHGVLLPITALYPEIYKATVISDLPCHLNFEWSNIEDGDEANGLCTATVPESEIAIVIYGNTDNTIDANSVVLLVEYGA